LTALTADLLDRLTDGRIKAYLLFQTLRLRRALEPLFTNGAYLPIEASGSRPDHVCAFARTLDEKAIIVVAPRLGVGLSRDSERPPLGLEVWGQTQVMLPPQLSERSYRNVFTGERVLPEARRGASGPLLGALLGQFPVALLQGDG